MTRSTPTTTVTRAHPLASSIEGSASTAPSSVTAQVSGAACSTRGVFSREAIAADAASNAQSSTPPSSDLASHQNLDLPRDAVVQHAAVQRRAVRPAVLEELRDSSTPAVVGVQRAAPHLEAQARLVLLRRRDARARRRARPLDCGRRRVSICSDVRRAPRVEAAAVLPFVSLYGFRGGARGLQSFWRPGIALMSNAVRGMHSGSLALRAAAMAFCCYMSRCFYCAVVLLCTAPCVSAEL